jgi:hypothetical protein
LLFSIVLDMTGWGVLRKGVLVLSLRIHFNLIINLTMIKSNYINCLALLAILGTIGCRAYLDETLFGFAIGALTLYLFQKIQKYGFRLTFWPGKRQTTVLVSLLVMIDVASVHSDKKWRPGSY